MMVIMAGNGGVRNYGYGEVEERRRWRWKGCV